MRCATNMHVANPGDRVMMVTPVAAVSARRAYVAELPTRFASMCHTASASSSPQNFETN